MKPATTAPRLPHCLHRRARAATLLEAVVIVAVVGLLAAMLTAAMAESRRQAGLTQNFSNLQQFAGGTTTYAADYDDRVWSFTDDHQSPTQAIDIIRSQFDGRPDAAPIANIYWPYYSHLVLLYHLDSRLLAPWLVSPEDDVLRALQRDPDTWPFGGRPPSNSWLYSYSSSYELGAAFTAPDRREIIGGVEQHTTDQHGLTHNLWHVPDTAYGNRFLHEVSSPSHKAMVYERQQRHFGPRRIFFMHPEARVPVLFADGSASVRRTDDANLGYRPNQPIFPAPTLVRYEPNGLLDAPTVSGRVSETLLGHYRWTRGGLKGRDFGATEIDTSAW